MIKDLKESFHIGKTCMGMLRFFFQIDFQVFCPFFISYSIVFHYNMEHVILLKKTDPDHTPATFWLDPVGHCIFHQVFNKKPWNPEVFHILASIFDLIGKLVFKPAFLKIKIKIHQFHFLRYRNTDFLFPEYFAPHQSGKCLKSPVQLLISGKSGTDAEHGKDIKLEMRIDLCLQILGLRPGCKKLFLIDLLDEILDPFCHFIKDHTDLMDLGNRRILHTNIQILFSKCLQIICQRL